MRDNLSLVVAAAGGFMLSIALAGILRGTPVPSWQTPANLRTYTANYVVHISGESNEVKRDRIKAS